MCCVLHRSTPENVLLRLTLHSPKSVCVIKLQEASRTLLSLQKIEVTQARRCFSSGTRSSELWHSDDEDFQGSLGRWDLFVQATSLASSTFRQIRKAEEGGVRFDGRSLVVKMASKFPPSVRNHPTQPLVQRFTNEPSVVNSAVGAGRVSL